MQQPHIDVVFTSFINLFSSITTRATYTEDLQQFLFFVERILGQSLKKLDQITEKILILYQHELKDYKASTRNRKISAVSSFLNYGVRKKLIAQNHALLLKRDQQNPPSAKTILTVEEVRHILKVCRVNAEIFEAHHNVSEFTLWLTYYTVLKLFFTVGLRVSELCVLTMDALETTSQGHFRLRLFAKGQEEHAPLIHRQTALDIKMYQEKLRPGAHGHEPLLLFKGKPLNRTAVYRMVSVCAKEAGILKHITPHGCRATLATLLHRQGVPVGQIKDLLNHKSIKTTAIYIKTSQEIEDAASLKINLI